MDDNMAATLCVLIVALAYVICLHGWPKFITINRFDKKD